MFEVEEYRGHTIEFTVALSTQSEWLSAIYATLAAIKNVKDELFVKKLQNCRKALVECTVSGAFDDSLLVQLRDLIRPHLTGVTEDMKVPLSGAVILALMTVGEDITGATFNLRNYDIRTTGGGEYFFSLEDGHSFILPEIKGFDVHHIHHLLVTRVEEQTYTFTVKTLSKPKAVYPTQSAND